MAIHRLTAAECRNVHKPGRYFDGLGLMLWVRRSKRKGWISKFWVQRIVVQGVRRDMGLGSCVFVTLAEARQLAHDNAKIARAGGDPRKGVATMPTFAGAMAEHLALKAGGWSEAHRRNWSRQMEIHALPKIGRMPLDAIRAADVLRVVNPLWHTSQQTGREVLRRVGDVLAWGVSLGHIKQNEAKSARAALGAQKKRKINHHGALDFPKVPVAIGDVLDSDATAAGARLGLAFLILCAARPKEVRGAKWAEIDIEARTWTVPSERMKAGREHVVPLSDAALSILDRAKATGKGSLVFPGRGGRPAGESAYAQALDRVGVLTATPHGFRSSFRDWASERTDAAPEVCELCLAHAIGNATYRAYARSDLLAKRRKLMALWGGYCLPTHDNVVTLRA